MVHACGDPEQALAWASDHTPDLVITDYKMPGMDGAELIRRFRQLPGKAEVPVIVITIYEERTFRLRALESGATDFLHSPVDPHEFVTRARNLLRLRKQQLLLETRLQYSERSREEALRDSRERLAQVIDPVPAMISATDAQGRFIFANAYHSMVTGTEPSAAGDLRGRDGGGESAVRNRALDRKVFEINAALP